VEGDEEVPDTPSEDPVPDDTPSGDSGNDREPSRPVPPVYYDSGYEMHVVHPSYGAIVENTVNDPTGYAHVLVIKNESYSLRSAIKHFGDDPDAKYLYYPRSEMTISHLFITLHKYFDYTFTHYEWEYLPVEILEVV
jgi:hypothetical protein